MRCRRFLVVLVVLLAGCSTGLPTGEPTAATVQEAAPDQTTAASPPPGPTSTAPAGSTIASESSADRRITETATPTSTPTATATPTPRPPDNPWRTETVVVNMSNEAGGAPQIRETIERALAYWEANSSYADYDVAFAYRPHAEEADITIRYVESIERCGSHPPDGELLGCAPYLNGGEHVRGAVSVRIAKATDEKALYNTIRHEFGHVLGIAHGEPPMPLMAENNLYTKAAPWNRTKLRVYVDYSDKPGIATAKFEEQIDPTLGYFRDGAEGTISPPPTYTRVDSRTDANVVISLHDEENPASGEPGSEMETISGDVDGTFYKRVEISLWDIDTEAVGWHVGYWLVYSFEREVGEKDVPPPFVDASYHERRSAWWR